MPCFKDLKFQLSGWSAWTENLNEPAAWCAWAGGTPSPDLPGAACLPPGDLPMMLRRRASPLGRTALAAAMGLPNVKDARYVLSSRHGELARTASILDSLARQEAPSPASFSMSIHHGLLGLLSIATGNQNGHSAISAGPESFCYGLLEAVACTIESPDQPVILIHYDEKPVDVFATLFPDPETEGPIVAALCLHGIASSEGVPVTMDMAPHDGTNISQNHALDFLRFVASGVDEVVSPGRRVMWEWSRA